MEDKGRKKCTTINTKTHTHTPEKNEMYVISGANVRKMGSWESTLINTYTMYASYICLVEGRLFYTSGVLMTKTKKKRYTHTYIHTHTPIPSIVFIITITSNHCF